MGGSNHLWLIGVFFDRGISGIRCVDITINLQRQAKEEGAFRAVSFGKSRAYDSVRLSIQERSKQRRRQGS